MAGNSLFSPRYIIHFNIEKEEVKQSALAIRRRHGQHRLCRELSSIETLCNVESLWKN